MKVFTRKHVISALALIMALQCSLTAQDARFPAFAPDHAPPAGYTGMVFELSQDYPTTEPAAEVMPWDSINFFNEPLEYARAVLQYGVEGNLEVDWVVQNNAIRKWYHAPWMHPNCNGREFIRGMTRERTSRPHELHPDQDEWCDNWAVGFYNPPGGFVLGQVWQNADDPDPTKATFPHGTVGLKLLFTTATVEEAPFLVNSLEWFGNIYPRTGSNPCAPGGPDRENLTLRLLQIDIAVRDSRKDATTGWVFGTFIYDGSAEGETAFDRMQPVGLMWANDSDVTTDMNRPGAFINPDLDDGKLNPALIGPWNPDNPAQVRLVHAGLGGRLNGPVDNPISSCMSCHGRAGAPSQPEIPQGISRPQDYTEEAFEQFFSDIPHGANTMTGADGEEYTSLDYSLQLDVGIRNFRRSLLPPDSLSAAQDKQLGDRGNDDAERWKVEKPIEPADKSKSDEPTPAAEVEQPQKSNVILYVILGLLVLVLLLFLLTKLK